MIKTGDFRRKVTPCAYCSMPAETEHRGEWVCMTHYIHPPRQKSASIASKDEQLEGLTEEHGE